MPCHRALRPLLLTLCFLLPAALAGKGLRLHLNSKRRGDAHSALLSSCRFILLSLPKNCRMYLLQYG